MKGCSLKGIKGGLTVCKFWLINLQNNIRPKAFYFYLIGSSGFKTKKITFALSKKVKTQYGRLSP